MPVSTWGDEIERQAVEVAEAVLRGVGDTTRKSIDGEPHRAAVHYRREMLPDEVARLPKKGIAEGYS